MLWLGKHKWVGVFIARTPNNFVITNGKGIDQMQFYSKAEGFKENLLSISNPEVKLDPHIVQKLSIMGSKWEVRYTGSNIPEKITLDVSSSPNNDDVAALKQKVLDVTRPAIFVPRKNFIEVESALTRLYGSAENIT